MSLFVLILTSCLLPCCAQSGSKKWDWQSFDFSDAGIRVELPCEPSRSSKIFQETPKLARRFEFKCEIGKFQFSISLAEHFGDFDTLKAEENINLIEKMLRQGIGGNAEFTSEGISISGFTGRRWSAKNETRLARHLHIENKRGSYGLQIVAQKRNARSLEPTDAEFDEVAKRLFDSFQINDSK